MYIYSHLGDGKATGANVTTLDSFRSETESA